MSVFVTTQHIFNNPWGAETPNSNSNKNSLPKKTNWDKEREPNLYDIKLWDQIYYKSGNIGIYAAWDPYVDYFIIVHNLFINTTFGVEEFKGIDAEENLRLRAKSFDIHLAPP